MTEPLSAAERIEIERACERIVYTYSRALDLGDMGAAADCFAENGSMARPKTLLTKHLATNVMIDVESRDEARGISNLTMISTTPLDDATAPYVSQGPVYFGEFKDRYVRENGVWKLQQRRGSIQMKLPGAVSL
jgi:hypothetical protein